MYPIASFIAKGMHITKNSKIIGKIWEDFECICQNRKVILYAVHELTNLLWIRCKKNISIVAAIDNDSEKQGYKLGDFFDEENLKEAKNVQISSKEILNNYNPDDVVILISSLRYHEEIELELDELGFKNYFDILNLEFYYREHVKNLGIPLETEDVFINNYAKECINKYKIQSNKIIFYGTGSYSEHGKYITEQLLLKNKNLDIVWISNKPSLDLPKGIRLVYEGKWKQYIYEMETAKIWIYSIPIKSPLEKREGQIYIQTKHWGSITLKKFYLDDISNNKTKQIYEKNSKWIDYIISGSEFDENSCRRGFGFNGSFLRFGSPRSDSLFKGKLYKEKIYSLFKLKSDIHILLYAPTYRFRNGNENRSIDFKWQDLNFELLRKVLIKKWNGEWYIFLRLHPLIRFRSNQIVLPDYVIDVSNYEDGQELLAISDVMISDFSSIMFEFSYILKPVFLYAPDKATYQKNDYELLLDYDSLPFPISTTNEELSEQILNFDEVEYKKNVQAFLDKYGVHEDGHASERAAEFIIKKLQEK